MRQSSGRILMRLRCVWATIIASAAVAVASADAAAATSVNCPTAGTPSPSPGVSNRLMAVSVAPTCQAWAVGSYNGSSGPERGLVDSWNGHAWAVQPTPDVSGSTLLTGVAATSATDVWAVGLHEIARHGGVGLTLVEHWDGHAWLVNASPNRSTDAWNQLNGVAAVGPNRAWAVGWDFTDRYQTLIEQWDGHAWKVQPSPNPGQRNELVGVAAVGANDAWAVGFQKRSQTKTTLIEHWDGRSWKVQPSPNAGHYDELDGVVALGKSNVWAVGLDRVDTGNRTLIEHWNGKSWKIQPSPNGGSDQPSLLSGVAASSGTDAWAVGSYNNHGTQQTLIEHWDGHTWSVESSPDQPSTDNGLVGVAVVSPTDAVTVGDYVSDSTSGSTRALIEYWDGSSWTG